MFYVRIVNYKWLTAIFAKFRTHDIHNKLINEAEGIEKQLETAEQSRKCFVRRNEMPCRGRTIWGRQDRWDLRRKHE
jgi:hypothetical protein